MAEAEDVITDAAQHATALALDLWKRRTHQDVPHEHTLSAHQKRLELLLRSLFQRQLRVRVAQAPARPTVLTRLFSRRPKRLFQSRAIPGQDGRSVLLPPRLTLPGTGHALAQGGSGLHARLFRVFAIQQAQRAWRRSLGIADHQASVNKNPLAVLVLLSEAVNADYELLQSFPGLDADFRLVRTIMRQGRPKTSRLAGLERSLETMYQQLLATAPDMLPEPFRRCVTPDQSLAWAQAHVAQSAYGNQPFWGIESDEWLGTCLNPEPLVGQANAQDPLPQTEQPRETRLERRPLVRQRDEDEDDPNNGFWMVQPSVPMEHAEDPMGMQRPTDREQDPDTGGMAQSLAELEETAVVSTPEPAKEILQGDDLPSRSQTSTELPERLPQGIYYPEWDYRTNAYIEKAVLVRLVSAELGPGEWVNQVLATRKRELQDVRRRFETLRTRRQIQKRQMDGSELDLTEYVASMADRRAGLPMSERLFQTERKARRDCAILLLIDVSGSTDAWVSANQRIIDVAKESLVLVTAALDQLGDPYAIQAFSGEGPTQVRVTELKSFENSADSRLNRRIAALEPDRFTRVGAALRHASTSLMKAAAQRRLLILLSDGKPNDTDIYETRYGIEDTRQAVCEAIRQGIHPVCITIDRDAPAYMPHVFGPARFTLLRQIHQLPLILLDLLRHYSRG